MSFSLPDLDNVVAGMTTSLITAATFGIGWWLGVRKETRDLKRELEREASEIYVTVCHYNISLIRDIDDFTMYGWVVRLRRRESDVCKLRSGKTYANIFVMPTLAECL